MPHPIDPDLALRAVRRQLAADAGDPDPTQPDLNGMDNLLADLMVLHLGFEVYAEWLNAQGQRITERHAKRAVTVLRRYDSQLEQMMEGPLKAIVERPDARTLQPSWRKGTQGSALSRIRHRARFFSRLLRWFSTRRAAANDLITSGKARQQIVRLYGTVDEEDPNAAITKLGALPSVSGSQQLRTWVREAAKRMGASITETEETLADAQTANAIADKISQIDKKIASTDTMSEEAAGLSEEKVQTIAELDSFVEGTSDPATVRASAVSAATTRPASKVAEELDLDPEKADFLMTRGKVLLAAGAGSGKCIDKDTLVQTERGLVAIGSILTDLSPGEERECPLWVHGPEVPVQATLLYRSGPGEAFKIKTSQGYEIIGTPAHRVYALNSGQVDWARLEDIQLGHTLCIDRRPGMFSETPFTRPPVSKSAFLRDRDDYDTRTNIPTELTPQVASLLGYIVSEGHVRRNLISLGTSDPNQMALYERALSGLIVHATEAEDNRRDIPFDERRFHRVADIAALQGFGLKLGLAHEKEIPAGVLQSPKPVVREFLRALFDGDGGVESNTVAYCTASEKLARQLHTLLLSFGVLARRKKRPTTSEHGESWHLYITGDSLRTFTSEIGFNLDHKQAAAEAIAERPSNTNIDVVPGVAELCADVVAAYKASRGTTHSTHPSYGAFKDYRKGRRRPSHEGLRRFLDTYELRGNSSWEALNALQDTWFFDTVVEIESLEADTYDFVVPEGHAFTGGGFINHNTYALTAAVKHYAEEEGVPPERILVTTFTKAATTEMGDRIRELGVRGAEVGTTHSISARIIRDYKPELNYAMKGAHDGRSDRLYRMAMKQVEMEAGGGRGRWAGDKAAGRGKGPRTRYYDVPANQWFNLGIPIEETVRSRMGKPKKRKIGAKRLKLVSDNWATAGVDPSTAWAKHRDEPGSVLFFAAAVYGAYEWLKGNDPQFAPCMDFVDWLKEAVDIVENNQQARKSLQDWFRVVIVDEAQDLNGLQWRLFDTIGENSLTYAVIGDDKQCVDENASVSTPTGTVRAGDLRPGDEVLAYRRGKIVPQTLRHVVPSKWEWGYAVTTESGQRLLMSPNHRLWATEPQTQEGEVAVYLMYRPDMGFRIGITNKGKVGSDGGYQNSYGGRAFLEKAERLWVLDICADREEALLREADYSLTYGIPTMVFNGEHRGLNQDRIQAIFEKHGRNGSRIIEERHLSLELPHWMSASYTKHGRERHVIHLLAHSGQGTQVSMEWTGDKFDEVLHGPGVRHPVAGVRRAAKDRRRLRRYFANYREGLAFAEDIAQRTGARISHRLSVPGEQPLRELTASSLFIGMQVPVVDEAGDLWLDAIVKIERAEGTFIDLDVDDASNFIAEGILTHNSIYEWRGADPDEFQDKRGQGFNTKLLTTNYRSGGAIVEAGNKLMAHNEDRQIKMVCKPKPSKAERGRLVCVRPDNHQAGAKRTAGEIADALNGGADLTPDDFGVIVRNNAEAEAFALSLASRGIPFRGKNVGKFFNKPHVKGLMAWVKIATEKDTSKLDQAITDGSKFPAFGLGPKFLDQLATRARRGGRSYYDVLIDDVLGAGVGLYGSSKFDERVESMARQIVSIRETFDSGEGSDVLTVLRQGLDVKGIDKTLREYIIDQIGPEDLDADDFEGVEPSEADIERAVDAMIRPLLDLAGVARFNLDPGKYLGFIDQMRNRTGKQATKGKDRDRKPAVRIDTCHQWKGLEAKHVYVCMAGGVFPFFGDQLAFEEGDKTALDSERRLAYVAITRGKETVTVLCPKENYRGKPADISQFVGEACIPLEGAEDGTEGGTPKTAWIKYNEDDDPVDYLMPEEPELEPLSEDFPT